MANVVDYVTRANSAQMRDKAFMDELVSWMRLSEADAVATMDGQFCGRLSKSSASSVDRSVAASVLLHRNWREQQAPRTH